MKAVVRRIWAALRTPPSFAHTIPLLTELAWLAPALTLLGYAGGLLHWQPTADSATFKLALVAIIAPALGEELLFRAAMMPEPRAAAAFPWLAAALSLALFVLWHPLQSLVYEGPFAELMVDPWFLGMAGIVGLACARLYWSTGSIWPPVFLHWIVVVAWKALFGGPSPWTG